ncbi:MAG: DUF2059 domain-containing protein [Deltaproteobacteria bacterium]|nr:DUF2059 domain-containing protein [Candidatus Tharpella aukensis]
MQKRNSVAKCLVITLIVSFLLFFQAPIKDHRLQSNAWAGEQKWSDAFGSSQGRTPSVKRDDSFDRPSPRREQYEKPWAEQTDESANHRQTQEKSVQTDSEQVSAADSSTTAEELLILFDLPAIIEETTEQSIEFLIKRSPDAAMYADVYREFGKYYLTWENLKEPMIKRYTESFSSQELQQLKIFFSSAIGKKYTQKSYKLIQETTQDIQKCLLSYQEELKRMIVEKEIAQFNKQN